MGLKNFQQLEQGSANRMQAVARDNAYLKIANFQGPCCHSSSYTMLVQSYYYNAAQISQKLIKKTHKQKELHISRNTFD